MLKDRTKFRLFLLLCVVIFMIGAVAGCYNPDDNEVNATYIRCTNKTYDWDASVPLMVIDHFLDLAVFLSSDAPKKYDIDFFATKSILLFGMVEGSSGDTSEIESYAIKDDTLSVYIKTKEQGGISVVVYWWFMLELTEKQVGSFENVKIFRDGEEITRYYNNDSGETVTDEKLILDYVNYAHSIGQKDVTVENTEILENYGVYDGAVIVKMNRGAYQVPTNISFLGTGVEIQFPDTNTPLVYKNGNFYELHDAYMNGILTKKSLIKLQDKISNGGVNDEQHITGPSPINNMSFFDFASFSNYFNDLSMNNYFFVSFDLDNLSNVATKNYFYSTNQPTDNLTIDPENYSHSIKYEFYSKDNPNGSGVDNTSYKIDCYDVLLTKNCVESDFTFKLTNEQDTILTYDLLLNGECVMKIKIDMEENYTSKDVEDIVLLLKNNIVIIQGWQL